MIERKFNMFNILTILEWNIIMDDWTLDGKSLESDNNPNTVNL